MAWKRENLCSLYFLISDQLHYVIKFQVGDSCKLYYVPMDEQYLWIKVIGEILIRLFNFLLDINSIL